MTLIWKTEEEQVEELNRRIKDWKQEESKDGYVLAAEGTFEYRKVRYLIRVLRYFNHTNKFCSIGSQRISDKHAVVEYPDETKPIVQLVEGVEGVYDFLYHDTLHPYNDNQTTEEQIEECHRLAKSDIDDLLGGNIAKQLDLMIGRLQEIKSKINTLENKNGKINKNKA